MLVNFNSNVSYNTQQKQINKQNTSFGSFSVPKTIREAEKLRDQATFKDLLPSPDNVVSLKEALKKGAIEVTGYMEDIAEKWNLKLEDLLK